MQYALEGPSKNIECTEKFLLSETHHLVLPAISLSYFRSPDNLHFEKEDIIVLCDGTSNEPTQANIVSELVIQMDMH